MKIYSWNVNGIRAVQRKGALEACIRQENPDILLIQETKAKEEQLDTELTDDSFFRTYHSAEKPGYAGTAIFVHPRHKERVVSFSTGMPNWNDTEGRVAQCTLSDNLVVITVYVPNGGKSDAAYQEKLTFLTTLAAYAESLQKDGSRVVIAGDFNVARSELDLAEPEKHREHTHFNEEVRAHMEQLTQANLVDTYRSRNPDQAGAYSYWDNFSFSLPKGTKPRDVNLGWRLDYIFADKTLDASVANAAIHQDIFGSDHCPVSITLTN
ncbi:MAG: exodeoxyribonuclease III [Candidatus Kaiserbacteria bacterium]|nr:exodeoxyribonuclease III [Candidatus Kaiserbacteria bacterium]